ncbi:MAG: hypothetical protein KY461_11600 [Actinobacteria bacterium]|nr:hypothetical protein [Actinomycetota bacterium]
MTGSGRPRLRPTRRGRLVLSGALLVLAGLALVVRQGGPGDVEGSGLTAGAALVVPSPSPSPAPSPAAPSWRPAVPAPLGAGVGGRLAHVVELADRSPVVVVADLTDRSDRDLATWLSRRLQAAVIAAGDASDRVGAEVVVAVGDVAVPTTLSRLPVLTVPGSGAGGGAPAEERAGPLQVRRAERVAGADEPPTDVDLTAVEDLLAGARPAAPTGAVLLARPGGVATAQVATALALGHRLVVTASDDPRADDGLRDALAGADVEVATVGDGWGEVDRSAWRWQLAVAARGEVLPGGGQLVFPGRMIVALYGHPDGPALGVLGEQPLAETLTRAATQAAAYDGLVDVPVVPALEIIATVASAAAGPDGDYSRRTSIEQLRPYVDAAREAGVFVVLDLQPGRTDFLTQAKHYEELLAEPHVGLALDPEWRLGPNDRHLVRIGSVGAAEVNAVVSWLADLTRREALPQKLLVLHQFKHSMITDRESIDTSREELAMVLHVDGQGGQPAKLATYASMLRDLSPDVWVGWKNFHDEDRPMRSEAETVTLDPRPVLVTYQ